MSPENGDGPVITIRNDGQNIVSCNYWQSPLVARKLVWCSVNAGAVRVLLPHGRWLRDMRKAQECVLSIGPWNEEGTDGVELLFDDGSPEPFVITCNVETFDVLPAEPTDGREWVISAWTQPDGKPVKQLEMVCHWRRVPEIPWLKPWGGKKAS